MSDQGKNEYDFKTEFENLGQNLKNVINTAWESEERKQVQQQVESGINELGQALNDFFINFSESEAGQQVKSEINELGERIRSGEMEEKASDGLLSVLKKINTELEKATENMEKEG